MALVAMCFNLMQEEAIENLKAFWRSLGCLRMHVKRGRDRIRGKRRRSQFIMDDFDGFNEQFYSAQKVQENQGQSDFAVLPHASTKTVQRPINQNKPVEVIVEYDYSNNRTRTKLNTVRRESQDERNHKEEIEMKYYKDKHEKSWRKVDQVYS